MIFSNCVSYVNFVSLLPVLLFKSDLRTTGESCDSNHMLCDSDAEGSALRSPLGNLSFFRINAQPQPEFKLTR